MTTKCSECKPGQQVSWRDEPMNENIRARLTIQQPKTYHPSFESAAKAWGDAILPGLTTKENA